MSQHENAPGAGCNRPEDSDTTSTHQRARGDVRMSIAPAPPSAYRPAEHDPADGAGIPAGTYVVVVKVDQGHRRRTYLSLTSAERAVVRARTRGQGAEVVLCQLVPVTGWSVQDAHPLVVTGAAA